ncbi:MAG: cation diffusion facilitator family transporter [Lachnospiraceae bacterium]|jgi:cation diffusion facilitator family transporter
MVSLLSRIFIKDYNNYDDTSVRRKYGMLSSIVGIFLNILLFTFKYFAGILSGSVAITADAFNNLSDAGSSIITLAGFKFTGRNADSEHPFGHGRGEYISGFIVSIVIILMGFELFTSSASKILHPEKVDTSIMAFAVLVISIVVKLYMAFYNTRIGRKINSSAMKATATDSLSDSVATSVVFLSMLVMKYTGYNIDGYAGALVAIFILFAGYSAAKDTISPLLGTKPSKEIVDAIDGIIMSHDGILGVHDLIVHDYGPGRMIVSLHAEVPGNRNIYELHDLIDHIENDLDERFNCECVIHMDPVDVEDKRIITMKTGIEKILHSIDDGLSIHDLRIVPCKDYDNIIFDMIVPPKYHNKDVIIKEQVCKEIEEKYPSYKAVIKIDKSYV